MSEEKYYVVHERVIPEIFEKVVKVKELIYTGEVKDITEGVKVVGISRSAFYKYKDFVFTMSEGINSKKITLAILLNHESGALSRVLDMLAEMRGNILTINQDIPMNQTANVTITLDVSNIKIPVKELLKKLEGVPSVNKVRLFAAE
jgi:chorismate mutase